MSKAHKKPTVSEIKSQERKNKRHWAAHFSKRHAKRTQRMQFDRAVPFDTDDPRVLSVNADLTATIELNDLYCIIIHNNDFDEDGVEVCVVYDDFLTADWTISAIAQWDGHRNGKMRFCGFRDTAWAEAIKYDEYFARENGNVKLNRKKDAKPDRKKGKRSNVA